MAVENITEDQSSLPWFQFYYQDFLVGTACLSLAERGAYITLICHQWTRGSIPDDATVRARLLGCAKRAADAAWAGIVDKFQQGADGAWRNARVELEREKQDRHRTNGAKGGYAKTRSRPPSQQPSQGLAKAKPQASHNLAEAKLEPSHELANFYPSESESESESEPERSRSALKSAPIFARATHPAQQHGLQTLHRGSHRSHAWCSERICVPDFQHEKFVRALGWPTADAELRALYQHTVETIPDAQPIESDPLKFWPPYVTACWPPASAAVGTRTAALQRATAEFLRGGGQ